MPFVFPLLAFGFFLVLAPVLIHLINLMRHRRVKWAAMEFLLAAYRKHRTWIWLKQLLLLLLRMVAVAAAVAMLAQPKPPEDRTGAGGRTMHHFVLLDDSYSMSERAGGQTAFDRGKEFLARLVAQAALEQNRQKLTLVRFSQAVAPAGSAASKADAADLADAAAATIDADFKDRFDAVERTFDVTELAVGPAPGLGVLEQLVDEEADERRVVYVVSDFRAAQWARPAQLRKSLQHLEAMGAEVHLIGCAGSPQPNLGVVYLAPADETRAAGVPLFVNVKVKNFGARAVANIQLKIRSHAYPATVRLSDDPTRLAYQTEELPTELIEGIGPGETVARRVQVYFPTAGRHVVEATLPDDPVAADNRRYCVVDFPAAEQVLVVEDKGGDSEDGSFVRAGAYYLTSVFRPGGHVNTGIAPETKSSAYLRDTTLEQLRRYRAIYVIDVERLDPSAVKNLEDYVREGGGVAFFMGPRANIAYYNESLYHDDGGLFPVPLGRRDLLGEPLEQSVPDMEVVKHPIFRIFSGAAGTWLAGIMINTYLRARDGWTPSSDSAVKVLARLRAPSRMPLVVERAFGEGRVVVFLTTLAPKWNNWARGQRAGPSIVPVLLDLQSYLAAPRRVDRPRRVGTPIEVTFDAARFQQRVDFVTPGAKPMARKRVEKKAAKTKKSAVVLQASLGPVTDRGKRSGETDKVGIYEAWATSNTGEVDVRRYALNVEPSEGDLTTPDPDQLLAALKPASPKFHAMREEDVAGQLIPAVLGNRGDSDRRQRFLLCVLLGLLVCLLLGEQLLAYSASYHPAKGGLR